MNTYTEEALENALKLTWKTQPLGTRPEIEQRLDVVKAFLAQVVPEVRSNAAALSVAPLTEAMSQRRMQHQLLVAQVKIAQRAHRTLERELGRRGGRS